MSLNKSDNWWNKRTFIAVSFILSLQSDPLPHVTMFICFSAHSQIITVYYRGCLKNKQITPLQSSIWFWCCSFERREYWLKARRWEVHPLRSHLAAPTNGSVLDFFWWPLSESHFLAEPRNCSSSLWSGYTHARTHTDKILCMCLNWATLIYFSERINPILKVYDVCLQS